ncbi:MAG: phosphoribosyltransferase [Acidobacteria bacterium]|nr:phosphoribosyltransferase [Acidobacteriota bacterium]
MKFQDRTEAGRMLANKLEVYKNRPDVVVLALPRGGVPVAYEVAEVLNVPLDVFLVRKLGVPGQEELAMGAIASGGVRVLNDDVVDYLLIPDEVIDEVTIKEQQELERREVLYRKDKPAVDVRGRTVILIDDGLATGSTMRAAAASLRKLQPARIVVAVPVAASSACDELGNDVDEIVFAATPEPFYAVGAWYEDFSQTTDEEIHDLLSRAAHEPHAVRHEGLR